MMLTPRIVSVYGLLAMALAAVVLQACSSFRSPTTADGIPFHTVAKDVGGHDVALIYFYRPYKDGTFWLWRLWEGAPPAVVLHSGEHVTKLLRGSYHPYVANPGNAQFSLGEMPGTPTGLRPAEVLIELKPGEVYYLKVAGSYRNLGKPPRAFSEGRLTGSYVAYGLRPSWRPTRLSQVSESEAKDEISECRVVGRRRY